MIPPTPKTASIRLEDMIDGPTKRYVTRVLGDFAAYKRLYFGG